VSGLQPPQADLEDAKCGCARDAKGRGIDVYQRYAREGEAGAPKANRNPAYGDSSKASWRRPDYTALSALQWFTAIVRPRRSCGLLLTGIAARATLAGEGQRGGGWPASALPEVDERGLLTLQRAPLSHYEEGEV